MFDIKKFKSALVLSGVTMNQLANKLHISESTLYRKLRRDGDFKRSEMQVIKDTLQLKYPDEIFFAEQLA